MVLAGCGSSRGFTAADAFPTRPRHPDGVAIDPAPVPVQGKLRGSTQSVGDVALMPAPALVDVRSVVHRFFDVTLAEDEAELFKLLAGNSLWSHPTAGRGAQAANSLWQERFRRLDYRTLAGRQVVREGEIEVYRYEDLENPPPGRPGRPPEMQEGDVLAKARLIVARVGADRYYGDEIVFLLRVEAGQYRIRWMTEEFQLP